MTTIQNVQAAADVGRVGDCVSAEILCTITCDPPQRLPDSEVCVSADSTTGANIFARLPGGLLESFGRDSENVSNCVPANPVTHDFLLAAASDFGAVHECTRRALHELGKANMLLGRVLAIKQPDRDLICLDGGANVHIVNNGRLCHDKVPSTMEVAGVLGSPTPCTGKGSLRLQPTDNLPMVVLTGAHVVEEFPYSFVSESLLTAKGCTIIKKDDFAVVLDPTARPCPVQSIFARRAFLR